MVLVPLLINLFFYALSQFLSLRSCQRTQHLIVRTDRPVGCFTAKNTISASVHASIIWQPIDLVHIIESADIFKDITSDTSIGFFLGNLQCFLVFVCQSNLILEKLNCRQVFSFLCLKGFDLESVLRLYFLHPGNEPSFECLMFCYDWG